MKKYLLPLMLCSLGSTAHADVMIGAQVGQQSLDVRTERNGAARSDRLTTNTAVSLLFILGQPGGGDRISLDYSAYRLGHGDEMGSANLGYTHFFPSITDANTPALRPFLGAELGYGWLSLDAEPGLASAKDRGLVYAARTGLNLAIADRLELEVGGRYGWLQLDATQRGPAGQASLKVESTAAWWLGVNFAL